MRARLLFILAGSIAATILVAYAFASSFSPVQEPSASPPASDQPEPPALQPAPEPEPSPQPSAPSPPVAPSTAATTDSAHSDRFGITELYPTATGGKEWAANWDNGHPRMLKDEVDPEDQWFDASHGEGTYVVDGKGKLTASGDYVRMYVHDPENEREWAENLEITLYVTRISETEVVDYSGLQVFARTNHGTDGDEDENICDDRGYGALALFDGSWTFEKETAHHMDDGYDDLKGVRPWDSLPKDTPVGVKYVLRNMDSDTKVKLELYRDLAGGVDGGKWEKVYEFIDDGTNFGAGNDACRRGVDPALQLVRQYVEPGSETGKPMLSVYARHEFGTMGYSAFSIREIDPLP